MSTKDEMTEFSLVYNFMVQCRDGPVPFYTSGSMQVFFFLER